MMDADIVYHRDALRLLLEAPARTTMLVSAHRGHDEEEVLVYGSPEAPRFLGKGLTPALVGGAPCIGEAVGIVKLAPADHDLARQIVRWLLELGPARRATEHEELTQRLMHLGRMRCLVLGEELPFMEVDSAAEYAELRERFYPRLLRLEAGL
jgi:choline kinase